MKSLTLLLAAAILACCALTARAEEPIAVSAEGVSAIVEGNIVNAERRALDDAFRKAVEQAAGVLVSAESVAQNFQLVEDRILTKAGGYITNYDVVSKRQEDTLYRVRINARVARGPLAADLSLLMSRKKMPRVMVIIPEQGVAATGAMVISADLSIAETIFMRALKAKGFRLVDKGQMDSAQARDKALAALRGDDKAAQALGLLLGAEVVITGKAVSSNNGSILGSSLSANGASVSARAVRTSNADVLFADVARATTPHVDPITGSSIAIEKATETLAARVIDGIVAAWTADTADAQMIAIVLTGVQSQNEVAHFEQILRDKGQGVREVYRRSFAGTVATLEVQLAGDADNLAAQIQEIVFGKFKAVVQGTDADKVTVEIRR